MKHSLKDYNGTSRLKAAAITFAKALTDQTPEAAYHIALLCESNALQPGEEAIGNLANAAADWFAANVSYRHAIQGLLENYPPANEAERQIDPAIMENSSLVLFADEFNPAEIMPLTPYITQCTATAMNYADALQAVIGNTFASDAAYVEALKRENEAKAATNAAMERLKAAQEKHDIAEMQKANTAFAESGLHYTGAAIRLITATLPASDNNGNNEAV